MTIKLNIFTNAEGMSENIKFDGHEMKYISFINRKWQFFYLFHAFLMISTNFIYLTKMSFPAWSPNFLQETSRAPRAITLTSWITSDNELAYFR